MTTDDKQSPKKNRKESAGTPDHDADAQRLAEIERRLADLGPSPTDMSTLEELAAEKEELDRQLDAEGRKIEALQEKLEALRRPPAEELADAIPRALAEAEARRIQACVAAETAMGAHVPTIANDWTFTIAPIPLVSRHKNFPAGEAPCPAYWFPGEALEKHKLTGKKPNRVLHRKKGIVLQGHDLGPVPQLVVALTPLDSTALSVVATLFAKRKCMFGAAKIVLEKVAPLGACTLTNIPPTPMMYCMDPISIPGADAPSSHLNTIHFPMAAMDYIFGLLEIGIDQALDALLENVKLADNPIANAVVKDHIKAWSASAAMVAALCVLGETDGETVRRVEVTVIDLRVWSSSFSVEKGQDGKLRRAEAPPPDDDAVMYSKRIGSWGEVI